MLSKGGNSVVSDGVLVRKQGACLVEDGVRDGSCRVFQGLYCRVSGRDAVVCVWTVRLSGSDESVLLRLSLGSKRGLVA